MKNETTLLEIIKCAKEMLNNGYSVLPLRMPEKRPIGNWKEFQEKHITPQLFFEKINTYDNVGIGVVCGKVSKNLECLDIDDKKFAGIGNRFLNELKEIYPELYVKLRIEKSINNGVHILYRVNGEVGRTRNLSKRYATEQELKLRPDLKTITFIEVKGEGGKITIPPTAGYSFIQENEPPLLSRYEADLIVNLALNFNEVVDVVKPVRKSTKEMRNYSINPFDDYNSTNEAENFLLSLGWKIVSDNRNFTYYQKPSEKQNGAVSLSFIKKERYFYCFSESGTGLESERGYSPSSLVCTLKFNNDFKLLFAELVREGYGKYTSSFEEKIIKKSIINNTPLPNNISEKSVKKYEVEKNDFNNKYPFGIFWETDENGIILNRELIFRVVKSLGFRRLNGDLVLLENNEITKVDENFLINSIKKYVKEDDRTTLEILDKIENYGQRSVNYLIKRLDEISYDDLLNDTRDTAYKLFNNGILRINKSGYKLISYDDNDKYYLTDDVINDDFDVNAKAGGLFVDFVNKAILPNENLTKYLGFLTHKYKDTSTPYFILGLETVENPKDGGGAGKNVLSDLLGKFTSNLEVSASQLSFDSKFFQSWNNERMMTISDLPPNFNFLFLKNLTSNSALVKKLYKDEVSIKSNFLPKLFLTSNYSVEIKDGGLKRRTMIIEFTDFFTRAGGVDVYFGGKSFPNDWETNDWQGYYHYLSQCIVDYLGAPKLTNSEISKTGWRKQFGFIYNPNTLIFIEEKIKLFLYKGAIPISKFNKIYSDFLTENDINFKYKISPQKMNDALSDYCKHNDIDYYSSKQMPVNGTNTKCKVFINKNP